MNILVVLLFVVTFCLPIFGHEEKAEYLLEMIKRSRVDVEVTRPYRICQGFEDPEEIDCYMRSDVKSYVCAEPVTFNPCESEVRVSTYHYDHIRHRCNLVDVPACSGYIIRSLTLIQCLIYCHNKDPFALGKSTSVVFKLNQKKPWIPKDEKVVETEVKHSDITKQQTIEHIRKVATGQEKESKNLHDNGSQLSRNIERIAYLKREKSGDDSKTVLRKVDDSRKVASDHKKESKDFRDNGRHASANIEKSEGSGDDARTVLRKVYDIRKVATGQENIEKSEYLKSQGSGYNSQMILRKGDDLREIIKKRNEIMENEIKNRNIAILNTKSSK